MAKGVKDFVAEAKKVIRDISPEEANGEGALLLDVREPVELQATGRVPNALNLPRGVLESKADPESDAKDEALVAALRDGGPVNVFCASGVRGALAAKTLHEMGYDARNIAGGIAAWREAGLPVERVD